MSHIKNIAIVGGNGTVGSHILNSLVAAGTFNVTVLSRAPSTHSFPASVTVKAGDYSSDAFFDSALVGQEALIITLPFTADSSLQHRLIEAAARAGVAYVVPNEFGSDNGHPVMESNIPFGAIKRQYRDKVEALGVSSWIGVINGTWLDATANWASGFWGYDLKARTATLYVDGDKTVKVNTTTLAQIGRGVAAVFSLPKTSTSGPSLADYSNKFLYVSSFHLTADELFGAVRRATGTDEADWKVTRVQADDAIARGMEGIKGGKFSALPALLMGTAFKADAGGDYEAKSANAVLGLPQEDLNEAVKRVIDSALAA